MRQVYRKTRGRKRKQLDSDVYKPSVRRMETDSVEALKSEVEICQNEIEEWKKRWVDLECEKQKKSSMKWRRNTQARGRNYWLDYEVNWDLADYGRTELFEKKESLHWQGKQLHELGDKQKLQNLQSAFLKVRLNLPYGFVKAMVIESSVFKKTFPAIKNDQPTDKLTAFESPLQVMPTIIEKAMNFVIIKTLISTKLVRFCH